MSSIEVITQPVQDAPLILDGRVVRCPGCKAEVTELREQDYCIRHNDTDVEVDENGKVFITVSQGQRDFETAHFFTVCCMAVVSIPVDGFQVDWS